MLVLVPLGGGQYGIVPEEGAFGDKLVSSLTEDFSLLSESSVKKEAISPE